MLFKVPTKLCDPYDIILKIQVKMNGDTRT